MRNYIRSRAPLRIGIAGGGTDVDPYASTKGGYVFNTTINKYAYCTLTPRDDRIMNVHSHYYGRYQTSLGNGPLVLDGNMDLIKAVANHFDIDHGFDLEMHSDVPAGSGLGGSSTLIVSMIMAVTKWIGEDIDKYAKARLAYKLEREVIGLKGGRQDQYASVFGGFNCMEFKGDSALVTPLYLSTDTINELQCRSVLCFTGVSRESADIIETQITSYKKGDNEAALDASKVIAKDIGHALEDSDIDTAGRELDEAWTLKKQFSNHVTNSTIDRFYNIAKLNGAIGGKVSGAGGGGFMYFICDYDKKVHVAEALKAAGAELTDFMFDPNGATSWKVGL